MEYAMATDKSRIVQLSLHPYQEKEKKYISIIDREINVMSEIDWNDYNRMITLIQKLFERRRHDDIHLSINEDGHDSVDVPGL